MFSLHVDTARGWRGGQSQVLQTVIGLRAIGHRAALVANPEGELHRRLREGHDLIPLAPRSDIDLSAAWALSRIVKQLRPDLLHAHDPRAVAMAATALSIVSPAPRPLLVASRRAEFRVAQNSFSRWKYSQVDCFIASCAAIRDRLVKDGIGSNRVVVIHDGVDVERIARMGGTSVHAQFYLPTNAPVVGTVAALVPQKGHQHLIDAAALVVREVPDARFVLLGEGPLRGALERHVKDKHLERHMFLAGFRTDVLELTKGVDVFAMSSIHEGMCVALVDAMAAGKPAVGTRAGGIPEVLVDGETGLLVEPRDHHGMAAALIRLLEDEPLRARMGAAGLARARERFTVERMVGETAALYGRLVGESKRRRAAHRSAPPPGS
jgi:glycosyltransferase involved in cell wall biosynthesis